ncbi:MAG TPA: APC family permease [Terriglobia bacterium]|nr:APC family permease [Terriglobia bacterium]
MVTLARKLRLTDYFTLAFGAMVGVGWLVVMDDWLGRGGPLGAILGFAAAGAALVPIGYVYGRLVQAIPDAGSEIAYTHRAFGRRGLSFVAGWTMLLAYGIVCPWEAVAIGRIAAYLFPGLDSFELYRVGGQAVYLPHLLLGLSLVALVTFLNYRGIRTTATFQNWTTFTLLALFAVFTACGLGRGSPANLRPLFAGAALISVVKVIQIVPYFMTGFESVPKCAEEAAADFDPSHFMRPILLALGVGTAFYISVIAVVAYVWPWPSLIRQDFATAVAFEQAFRARWIADFIMAAAIVSLIKIFNGNFVVSSRVLFALGRQGLAAPRLGAVHPGNRTPALAVLGMGVASAAALFLGPSILVPVTEVGSMASALGWFAACAAYWQIERRPARRIIAWAGGLVALALVLMKVLPFVPGHFTRDEGIALGVWALLGAMMWLAGRRGKSYSPQDVSQ